jgi:hypothetical protein
MYIHESFFHNHKKMVIFSAVGAFLLVICMGYAWKSYDAWQVMEKNYTIQRQEVSTLTQAVLYDNDLSLSTRQAKLKYLSSVKAENMCKISGFYVWQRFIVGSLESMIKTCESSRSKDKTVVVRANNLQHYMIDERSITKQLQRLESAKELLTLADSTGMLETLKQVSGSIEQTSIVTTEGKELKVLSIDILKAAIDSWAALIQASEKQDRSAYEAELTKLTGIYDRFSEIGKQSTDTYQQLLKSLQLSYAPSVE